MVGNRCCGSEACHLTLELKAAVVPDRRPDARQRIPTGRDGAGAPWESFGDSVRRRQAAVGNRCCGSEACHLALELQAAVGALPTPGRAAAHPYRARLEIGRCVSRSEIRRLEAAVGNRCCGSEACHTGARIAGGRGALPAPGRAAAHPYRTRWSLGAMGVVRRFSCRRQAVVGNRCCGSEACHMALELKAAVVPDRRPDARQRIPTGRNGAGAPWASFGDSVRRRQAVVGNRCCGSEACHLALELKAAVVPDRRPDARQRIPTGRNGAWAPWESFGDSVAGAKPW